MKIKVYSFFIITLLTIPLFAQIDYLPADNTVYEFLKKQSVRGLINYDDAMLPLNRAEVKNFLDQLTLKSNYLSLNEVQLLEKYILKLNLDAENSIVYQGLDHVFSSREKNFYSYADSVVVFTVNPLLDLTYIYSSGTKKTSQLLNFGGRAYGSYNNWFGFSAQATNGVVFGDRNTAGEDYRVKRSFSFNETQINYFDAANGHLALHSGIFNFQLGREKILMGRGTIDRMLISGYAPDFDFVRFSLKYKALSYNFIHGWLVQPVETRYVDSMAGDVRFKSPKYIASNRLGVEVSDDFSAGITQSIIYSERPVEAAYLNPFLLWESAQRSLNDLDNSFLTLDLKWRVIKGLEWNFSFLVDDVHFGRLFDQGWNIVDNRSALQTGIQYLPSFLPDLTVKMEYSLVRPYTFSHAAVGEALTYTNNRYFLGLPFSPNSVKYSAEFGYLVTPDLDLILNLASLDHGANRYSADGKLINNYGGNIFENLRLIDSREVHQLQGIREKSFSVSASGNWEFLRNYFLTINYIYNDVDLVSGKTKHSTFSAAFILALQ